MTSSDTEGEESAAPGAGDGPEVSEASAMRLLHALSPKETGFLLDNAPATSGFDEDGARAVKDTLYLRAYATGR